MRHPATLALAFLLLLGGGILLGRTLLGPGGPGTPEDPSPLPRDSHPDEKDAERPQPPAEVEDRPEPLEPGILRKAASPGTEGWLTYPDGTALPPLNGVTGLNRPLMWPEGHSFTPVVGKVRLFGEEWYLHENGLRSTTLYGETFDAQGRPTRMASGVVFAPEAPVPLTNTGG